MQRPSPDRWMGVVLGVMIAGLLVASWLGAGGSALIQAGEPMPAISGRLLGGGSVSFEEGDSGGDVLLIEFWATWCPPCVKSLPSVQRLSDELEGKGLRVLTINTDRTQTIEQKAGLVGEFMRRHRLSLPVLLDGGEAQHAYNAFTLPTMYLVGRDGVIIRSWTGSLTERSLRRRIARALEQEAGE